MRIPAHAAIHETVELVKTFEPRLQELVGYGVYRGLIGQIEKQSPAQRLLDGAQYKVMWDREADAAARKTRS
jgi:ectoine hydroxylase-related dioxygenase (phytanoyl-CoA dioxygenase family)